MTIHVACPNGHRLACPDERAGKQGKCPKCDVTFLIPETGDDDSGVVEAEPTIAFLCPNGHKLNGPSSLQGQPGQCPNCGAKFRIPVYDDEQVDDGLVGKTHEEEFDEHDLTTIGDIEEMDDLADVEDLGALPNFAPPLGQRPAGDFFDVEADTTAHPMARLFPILWQEREHGGVIELRLAAGDVVVPDWWASGLSQGDYGVFALQTNDGTYVMEAIAWESVKRITVRRITELPGGVFG